MMDAFCEFENDYTMDPTRLSVELYRNEYDLHTSYYIFDALFLDECLDYVITWRTNLKNRGTSTYTFISPSPAVKCKFMGLSGFSVSKPRTKYYDFLSHVVGGVRKASTCTIVMLCISTNIVASMAVSFFVGA